MALRGDRLREMRERAGLSQTDLSELVEISKRQIGRYEQGVAQPAADALTRIARSLNCSSDYLLGLVDAPNERLANIDPAMERFLIRFGNLDQDTRDLITRLVFRD